MGNEKIVYDHKGNKFNTEKEMCEYWGVKYSTYKSRKKKDYTLQECLEGKDIDYIYDHKGNNFISERKMCKYWNINYSVYRRRKQLGWSLQECLEGRLIYDHKGNKFNSEKEMCDYWGINYNVYHIRKQKGWILEECLNIIPHISLGNKYICGIYLTDNLYLERIKDINSILYCECLIDNNPIILSKPVVEDICRKYNMERINKLHENDDINYRAG